MASDVGGASTDLFTNYMQLGRLGRKPDVRPWLGMELVTPPSDELSVFLHEVVHHWCFLTPVNFAITALTASARLQVARYTEGKGGEITSSPFVSIAGAHAGIHLLRPFNEGLALFAEFDMMTRLNSRVESRVMDLALLCFSRPENWISAASLPLELKPTAVVAPLLTRLRTGDAAVAKRASLFLRPLDPAQDPYLLGYLSVKSLCRSLARADGRLLSETDLSLTYLRSYVFSDAGLVCALLEPAQDPEEVVDRIVRRLNERLNDIDELTRDDIEAFEDHVLSTAGAGSPANVLEATPGIRQTNAQVDRAAELLDEQTSFWKAESSADDPISAVSLSLLEVLNQRHNATLVSADVQLVRDGAGPSIGVFDEQGKLFDLIGEDIFGDEALDPGPARLDVVINMHELSRAAIVSSEGRAVACRPLFTAEASDRIREDAARWFREQGTLAAREAGWGVLDAFLLQPKSSAHDPTEWARGIVLQFWQDIAFRYARDYAAVDESTKLMHDRGFRVLLKTSSLVQRMALIGLATSVSVNVDHARKIFDEHGWDLDRTLEDLNAVFSEYGFPPVPVVMNGTIYSSI